MRYKANTCYPIIFPVNISLNGMEKACFKYARVLHATEYCPYSWEQQAITCNPIINLQNLLPTPIKTLHFKQETTISRAILTTVFEIFWLFKWVSLIGKIFPIHLCFPDYKVIPNHPFPNPVFQISHASVENISYICNSYR